MEVTGIQFYFLEMDQSMQAYFLLFPCPCKYTYKTLTALMHNLWNWFEISVVVCSGRRGGSLFGSRHRNQFPLNENAGCQENFNQRTPLFLHAFFAGWIKGKIQPNLSWIHVLFIVNVQLPQSFRESWRISHRNVKRP